VAGSLAAPRALPNHVQLLCVTYYHGDGGPERSWMATSISSVVYSCGGG
jgi:hypothetical protein